MSEWLEDVHVRPLTQFFQDNLLRQRKTIGVHLLEAGLVNSKQLEAALNEQRASTTRLGEILSKHNWVKQQTVDYLMEKVVQEKLSGNGHRLGRYLLDAGLVKPEQIESALDEQKKSGLCLGEILSSHGWVSQQTIEYMMEKIILPERQVSIPSGVGNL